MAEKNNPCANLVPMEEWVRGDSPVCRPCVLAPVTQWYSEVLQENGLIDLAHSLESLADNPALEPVELAKQLDTIKGNVPESIRQRLLDFDCSAQAFEEN